jgi:hypothetical protein
LYKKPPAQEDAASGHDPYPKQNLVPVSAAQSPGNSQPKY